MLNISMPLFCEYVKKEKMNFYANHKNGEKEKWLATIQGKN